MLDHEAIFKAYPDCIEITDADGAFKSDGSGGLVKIELDQSLIDSARVELNKLNYRYERVHGVGNTSGYDSLSDQLDQLYHDMTDGKFGVAATTGNWYVGITSVKNNIPKPS
tara:strand:- start:215 stop:550 length:336 start_codon:yes stop_codon:yes gene_type:complete